MKTAILLSPDAPASGAIQTETPAALLLKKARIEISPGWLNKKVFMSKINVGLTTEQAVAVIQRQREFDEMKKTNSTLTP